MPVDVNFRAVVWLFCFLRCGAPWHIHPHAWQSLPRAWKRSCLRPASVAPCFVFQKNKKQLGASRENALGPSTRKKNRCMGGTGTERGAPANTRALDNPKTAADRKHEHLQACRRQLHGGDIVFPRTSARVLAIGIAQVRSWREGGSARWRSLQRLQFTMQSVLQTILPMCILYSARIIDRCARSESMP
jgi:hypothetical protein